jgi:hypothetical protein
LDGSLGDEPRSVGIALADGLCDLRGGKTLWLKASMIGEGGQYPFELYLEKHGKPVRVAE